MQPSVQVHTLTGMKVTRIETEWLRVPLPRPVALASSQDPRSVKTADLILVHLHTDHNLIGLGMTYTLGDGGRALKAILDDAITPIVLGEDASRIERLYLKVTAELEGLGFAGLAARAYAAFDFALWDLKGKCAGLPVHSLLGGYRTKLKAIVSDTATPALGVKQAARETRALLDRGAAGVIVEIGTQDPDIDADRVRQLREVVPEGAWFEVSGNGRYDYATALFMGQMFEEEFGIDGFSDPLRPSDEEGLQRLIERLDVPVAVGSRHDRPEDFLRLLRLGGISALRIDPVRIGGITPARKIITAAELQHVSICPVRLPEVGTHLAAGCVLGRVVEYVDWFQDLWTGGPRFEDGQLLVPTEPGLGLTLNEEKRAAWRAGE